jgi:myosin heavy subunit
MEVSRFVGGVLPSQTELPLVDKSGEPNTHPADPSHMDNLPDIALMNNLHQAPLLHLLRRRYLEDAIYTFTGDILISINPYMLVEGLYDIPDMDETEIGEYFIKKKIPHVFTVAERAYKAMREEANPSRKNQSMIVSGESGAGKTEACKRIMQFLAFLSEGYSARHERRSTAAARTSNIEKRVLDCNPFLEAFGNAMTVRNNNSSRFGKFLKIEYQRGYIVGASMRHYLLEKARVVSPQAGERNYHIFYQLCRGADAATAKRLSLRSPEEFHYLGAGGTTTVPGVDDKEEFEEVVAALTDVGIPEKTQQSMWTAVAAIAHLGDIEFEALGDADAEASKAADPARSGPRACPRSSSPGRCAPGRTRSQSPSPRSRPPRPETPSPRRRTTGSSRGSSCRQTAASSPQRRPRPSLASWTSSASRSSSRTRSSSSASTTPTRSCRTCSTTTSSSWSSRSTGKRGST